MAQADKQGYKITMHVHDEIVCEVEGEKAKHHLQNLEQIMSVAPEWAKGLPLDADGYITNYYKKD
jgi:DNA polymerase